MSGYLKVDEAILLDRQVGDVKALLLQDTARVQDALVLLHCARVGNARQGYT